MKYTLFKPTPKNTGALVDFTTGKDNKGKSCVYVNLVKQKSWDNLNKTGSFSWSGDEREGNTAGIKFDITELGNIVYGFRTNFEHQIVTPKQGEDFNGISLYHKSKDFNTIATIKVGQGRGFFFSVMRGDFKMSVGITYGEAEVLCQLFETIIKDRLDEDYQEEQERLQAQQEKSKAPAKKTTKKTAKKEVAFEDSTDTEEVDEEIPF